MRSRTLVGGVQRRYRLRLPRTAHRLLGPRSVRAPGNHQSAGKRISVSTRHGNKWLGATLVKADQAAGHVKDSYLSAQYHRLAALGGYGYRPYHRFGNHRRHDRR